MNWVKSPAIETYAQRIGQLIPVESKDQVEKECESSEGEETKENGWRRKFANYFTG